MYLFVYQLDELLIEVRSKDDLELESLISTFMDS